MKYIERLFRMLLLVLFSFPTVHAQDCKSYNIQGSEITFSLDNGTALRMKLCSQSIVKVWNSPDGKFVRKQPSFAVVNDTPENIGKLNIEEQAACYEIFTTKLRIRINKSPFSLQIFDKYQKLVFGDAPIGGRTIEGTKKVEYKMLRRDEHFFGLGEKTGEMDRRGEFYKMWNSDKPCYNTMEDPLYKSIPFFMSNYHYGVFLDNTYMTEFNFGNEKRDSYSFEVPDGDMIYYFIYGKDYKDVLTQYISLTGNPIMPPRWAMGFAQSRGLLTNEDLTYEIADGYRKRGIPCDIIYQDIGWTEYLQDFSWRKGNYTNPRKMLSDLKSKGFKVIVSQDPVISQANKKQWQEADSMGYFVKDIRTGKSYNMPWPWGGDCGVVDFTLPEVSDWWGAYQQKCIDDGVRGFWTDMGEPAWSNEESVDRLNMMHNIGMHSEIHNVYGLTWDKVVKEQFEKRNPDKRVFQMTRAAYAGLQRYTFGWTGDCGNGDDVLQGWDQMANQIPVCLSAGLGGIPFNTCDISGYCGDIKDYPAMAELYVRWVQMGAFTALSRIHHEGNNACEPWLFGAEAEECVTKAIKLKYRLLPYIYSAAREAHDTGIPIMRPMFMEYPMDAEAITTDAQFMFGSNLLVAPVVKKGAVTKNVYFPQGRWINYNDKITSYQGDGWQTVSAPLDVVPIFVKEGSIIPTVEPMNYTDEKKDCPIKYEIFPMSQKDSVSYSLYEDDGESLGYERGESAKTNILCKTLESEYKIVFQKRVSQGYNVPKRVAIAEIYMPEMPKRVQIGNIKVKKVKQTKIHDISVLSLQYYAWSWDSVARKCSVIFPDEGDETIISIINKH